MRYYKLASGEDRSIFGSSLHGGSVPTCAKYDVICNQRLFVVLQALNSANIENVEKCYKHSLPSA